MNSFEVPFFRFLLIAFPGNPTFVVPIYGIILLFNLLPVDFLLFLLLPFFCLSALVFAAISWLIAKGSNWENPKFALLADFSIQGRVYCAFLCGLLGSLLFGTLSGIILMFVFYIRGKKISMHLGEIAISRVVPELT